MRSMIRVLPFVVMSTVLVSGQQAQLPAREGLMGDLLRDVAEVNTKIVGLAKAMPASAWEWRPGPKVRSTSEVVMHVAADNYFIPAILGIPAPAETGITTEYKTAAAFETRKVTSEQAIAEVEKSFAFLKTAMESVPDEKLGTEMTMFGRKRTLRSSWIMGTTHLHEHLGQLIAYARSNNVVPPWSK